MSTAGSSLARIVIQVHPNNVCLMNCEGKAGTGLHVSQVIWKRAAQEQLKSCERCGKSRQMRGSQKAKHEGDDPVQHHSERYLQSSPVEDGGKGAGCYEMSRVWMSGSACRWLGKAAHQQCNTSQGCVVGKTARQAGWEDEVHGGPECRPCGVVWRHHERQQWGGLWARMGWC